MLELAVAQTPASLPTPNARLEWLGEALPAIVEAGADLVLLPELFVCGYNIGQKVRTWAEPLEGPAFEVVSDLARRFAIAIHYGFAERAGDLMYNAAMCVGPDGAILTHHRKLAIPPGQEQGLFEPGQGCRLFEYGGVRIATLICYDAELPETTRHVASLGAELVLVPTALGNQWDWVAETLIPARAYENGIYLAYANHSGVENGLAYLGKSAIVAPDGREVSRASNATEVIFGSIDLARVKAAQARLPYLKACTALKL